MFRIGTGFYVRDEVESQQRVLHPATITGFADGTWAAFLHEDRMSLEPDRNITIYFEQDDTFFQQTARICHVTPAPELHSDLVGTDSDEHGGRGGSFAFELIGEPCSAESREIFRVCTVLGELTFKVADDQKCPLIDISTSGCSAITKQSLPIGEIVEVILRFQGRRFAGMAVVKSARELSLGRVRYGLQFVQSRNNAEIMCGASFITMALQRQHLQRLSASA